MMQKFACLAAIAITFVATDSEATTLVVNLTNPTETTYKSGNEWFLKTQGITFSGAGPVSIGGGSVFVYDSAIYDEGTGTFTLEDLPFAAKSVTFDLTRIHTSTFCNIFVPQTCIDANKISATAYDALGNLLGSYTTTDTFTSIRFASELGIGRVVWTGARRTMGASIHPSSATALA
ncbi:hypothetical protein ASG11_04215 [Sphingomonas sp. Leaf357]|uniref:hypothetical protein n=1 Tax=Sphingomonas sp. Leaf357 TaxID=1736350 RepID=UPI0006F89806|nr:hypothetical protein [Sphingomonas sp. Leaf357]KQS03556.1 hypothetical protein ASG11_04215 [Sphingomonas sp. Leaf357]